MDRTSRWNDLLGLLARKGRLSVEESATLLGVSAATIRRDFEELANQQMLTRTRGGAVANSVAYDLPLRYKSARKAPEKQRIGAAAAAMVEPGMVVGLNGGTTTTEVGRALGARGDLQAGNGTPLITIVTNALNIAHELTVRPHVKVVLIGGVVRTRSYEVIGPLARSMLLELTLDILFLGVDALDADYGATAYNEDEASTNHLMVSRARNVVVVSDSTKLGQCAFARICGLEEIDGVITDTGAPDAVVKAFEEAGLSVTKA